MSLTVYNWEIFDRTNTWYIVFGMVFALLIIFSIIYWNYTWAIVLFILLGWYIFFNLWNQQKIKLIVSISWLTIWQKTYNRSDIEWFWLEINETQDKIKNIIFIIKKNKQIFTISDDSQNTKNFIWKMIKYTDMIDTIGRNIFEKITRYLRL